MAATGDRDPGLPEPVRGARAGRLRGLGVDVSRTTPCSATSAARREEARGWFRDGMHFPEPMFPFDFVTADSPYLCLGQANSRIFAGPARRSGSTTACSTAGST